MKRFCLCCLIVTVIVGVGAIALAIHEVIPSETQVPEPGANAEKLNEYIIKYNPYRTWNLWPGKKRLYQAKEPLGLVTTFVNSAAYHSIMKNSAMTDGSIIVTENYSADKKFLALFVMYKIKGYNPEAGDWFWVKYLPDGKAEISGKVKMCIDCHAKKRDTDYLFTGGVKK